MNITEVSECLVGPFSGSKESAKSLGLLVGTSLQILEELEAKRYQVGQWHLWTLRDIGFAEELRAYFLQGSCLWHSEDFS